MIKTLINYLLRFIMTKKAQLARKAAPTLTEKKAGRAKVEASIDKASPTPKTMAKIAETLTTGKKALDDAKVKRAAERATRFPTQAKIDAEKAAEKPKKKAEKVAKVEKVAEATVAFIARMLPKGQMAFVLAQDARPTQPGARLYAHTHAALHLLGMFSPTLPAVSERSLLTLIGQRAVAHHCSQNNFVRKDNMIAFTGPGYQKFKGRNIDGKLANAFMDLFITGKVDPVLQVPEGKVYSVGL